jgi:hypothetical protein
VNKQQFLFPRHIYMVVVVARYSRRHNSCKLLLPRVILAVALEFAAETYATDFSGRNLLLLSHEKL